LQKEAQPKWLSPTHSMKRLLPFIIILVVALAAAGGGKAIYRDKKAELAAAAAAIPRPAPVEGQAVEVGAKPPHLLGQEEKAKVIIEEFGDYQCPPCRTTAEMLDKLQQEYGGKLVLVFRQFPLTMHEHAMAAACAAEAAGAQNRFWEMHHLLYENQAEWSAATDPQPMFDSYAEKLHLVMTQFKSDLGSEGTRARILADQARGTSLGVTGTPTLFLNDERAPFDKISTKEALHSAIEAALSGKKGIFAPVNE
jgi:protein-disulfide isomerase